MDKKHAAATLPKVRRRVGPRTSIIHSTPQRAEHLHQLEAMHLPNQHRALDAWRRQLEQSIPVRRRAEDWIPIADRSNPLSLSELQRTLEGSCNGPLILSLSHEDYARNFGGVQILIDDEQRAFARAGWSYLHVSPASPLPILADPMPADAFRVGLRLDGQWLGVASFSDLLQSTAMLRGYGAKIELIIHHFLGHAPELVLTLLSATGATRPILWVHDFFTLCPSYALMRNDVTFCGAPPLTSGACAICSYGDERKTHLQRIQDFCASTQPIILAPSEAAIDLWRHRSNHPSSEVDVVPHARLITAPSDRTASWTTASTTLRVAHLGARLFYKGWHVFEELARTFAVDDRYLFFQLGTNLGPHLPDGIRNIPVSVTGQQRLAMVEAVAEARIDVVVNWSLCFETFSFSTYEALAGGACIVTHLEAGNIWPAVQTNAPGQGCAVSNEAELFELFAGDQLQQMCDASPHLRGTLMPEGGTAHWLLARSGMVRNTTPLGHMVS